MDQLEQEVHEIREEVITLRAEIEELSTLVAYLVALQNQPQFWQGPPSQHRQQPRQLNHVQRAPQFDPIPMTYAELLPILLQRNLVQTRAPPQVPNELPVWYQPNLLCTFHQGAPGHDVEHYRLLKTEVHKLIRANILSFED